MDDSQLLKVTASPTDVETLRASHKRLCEIVEEQRKLLDAARSEIEQLRQRFGVGTRFHSDSSCGSCGGPLEVERDAVCIRCTTEIERDAARAEMADWDALALQQRLNEQIAREALK